MFEKFGEFDSVEELNRAAAAQKAEGDEEALLLLAEENGIDREDAMDYLDGAVEEFATPSMAAAGKLEVEARELKLEGMLADWKDQILQMCMEDDRLCRAVRGKGASLEQCLGRILKSAFEKKSAVSEKIVKAAGLRPPLYMGMPGRAEVRKIVLEYYMEGRK